LNEFHFILPKANYTRTLTLFLQIHQRRLLTLKILSRIIHLQLIGEVLELADRRDLGSRAATRESSTLSFPTVSKIFNLKDLTLKIEKVIQEDRQAKLSVEYEAHEFEGFKRRAAKKISKNAKIPGFRPGKAPYQVIVNQYGEGAVVQEAIDLLIDDDYSKILKEAEIEPSGVGTLESMDNFDPPKFVLIVPLEPEVDLGDYREIRIPYEPEPFDTAEVDDYITQLRRNSATIVPAERPAEENDLVYFSLSGEFLNPDDDEDATITDKTPQQVVIPAKGEEIAKEWPYLGFSRDLLGVKAGDVTELQHIYPEDHDEEDYQGKTAIFTVEVQSVKALELPEFDDDFVQTQGEFETPEDFREAIEKHMQAEHEESYELEYYNALLAEIRENSNMNYPPQMLEHEEEHVLEDIKTRLKNQNLDFTTYLKLRDTDEETFIAEEVQPVAKQRLERSLITDALIKAEGLKLDQDLFNEQVSGVMNSIFRSGRAEELQKEMGKDEFSRMISMEGVTRTINAQLMNRLKLIGTGQPLPEEDKTDTAETTDEESVIETDEVAVDEADTDTADLEQVEEQKPVQPDPTIEAPQMVDVENNQVTDQEDVDVESTEPLEENQDVDTQDSN
jgi:trigger factor